MNVRIRAAIDGIETNNEWVVLVLCPLANLRNASSICWFQINNANAIENLQLSGSQFKQPIAANRNKAKRREDRMWAVLTVGLRCPEQWPGMWRRFEVENDQGMAAAKQEIHSVSDDEGS